MILKNFIKLLPEDQEVYVGHDRKYWDWTYVPHPKNIADYVPEYVLKLKVKQVFVVDSSDIISIVLED